MSDESLLIKVFGVKSPVLKILDFLIDNEVFDYSKTEIAEGAGISKGTLFSAWGMLEENDLVIVTREVGRSKMYKLNKENPIVEKLMELDDTISNYYESKYFNTLAEEESREDVLAQSSSA